MRRLLPKLGSMAKPIIPPSPLATTSRFCWRQSAERAVRQPDTDVAGALGDEHGAVAEEGDLPGVAEPGLHRRDLVLAGDTARHAGRSEGDDGQPGEGSTAQAWT